MRKKDSTSQLAIIRLESKSSLKKEKESSQNKNMIVGDSLCFVSKTGLHRVIIYLEKSDNNETKIFFQVIFLDEYLIYVKLLKMSMRFEIVQGQLRFYGHFVFIL